MTSVHELICKLAPFSDAVIPEPLAQQVLDLAKASTPKISLDDFGYVHPDLKEIAFSFDHMVRLDFFQVFVYPVLDDDTDDCEVDLSHVQDLLNEKMNQCTHMTDMRGKDVLAFFTDEALQFFETNSILLTCDSVPLTDNQVISIGYNTDS